jgi:hypothetical protein
MYFQCIESLEMRIAPAAVPSTFDFSDISPPEVANDDGTFRWNDSIQLFETQKTITDGGFQAYVSPPIALTNTDVASSVSVTLAPASVSEDGPTDLVYTFIRSTPFVDPLDVMFAVSGDATFDNDYTQSGAAGFSESFGMVSFPAGSTTINVCLDPAGDPRVETDENVTLELVDGAGYTVATKGAVIGTITNDDINVAISVSTSSATEDADTNLEFAFTRSGLVNNPLTVNFSVAGSATFGSDYSQSGADTINLATGTVTFSAEQATAMVIIDPTADSTVEIDESVALSLEDRSTYPVRILGAVHTDLEIRYIKSYGKYILGTTIGSRLFVIDPTIVSAPQIVAELFDPELGFTCGFDVQGRYAFVATSTSKGLAVVDLIDPANPILVATIVDPTNLPHPIDVVIKGDYAFVCNESGSKLTVVDISVPTAPAVCAVLTDEIHLAGASLKLLLIGDILWVGTSLNLTAIDVSTPQDPVALGSVPTAVQHFAILGGYAYTAGNSDHSIKTVDISNPISPKIISTTTDTVKLAGVDALYASGDSLYAVSQEGSTFAALDISDPLAPVIRQTIIEDDPTTGRLYHCFDILVSGGYAFVAAAGSGYLTVVDVGAPYTVTGPRSGTGIILNDDVSVTLSVAPSTVTEDGAANLVYTFTRRGVIADDLTVDFAIGGEATFIDDYTQIGAATYSGTAGTVILEAGEATATVVIDPKRDVVVEGSEAVSLTLIEASRYTVGEAGLATGTIAEDDTAVTLMIAPSTVTEDGSRSLVYTFTRAGLTTNALTVSFEIGGTATVETDYTQVGAGTFGASGGTVTFAAGAASATVTLQPRNDTIVEGDETTSLRLTSGDGYGVSTMEAITGIITDDDTDVFVSLAPASVLEDETSKLVYTFTRHGVTGDALTIIFSVGGTASLGGDYTQSGAETFTGTTGSIIFAAGASTAIVSLDPSDDKTVEDDENVVIAVVTGDDYNVSGMAATGAILNDDTSVTLSVAPSTVTEDGAANLVYTFTRSGLTSMQVSVDFAVAGTAAFGEDYLQTGALAFGPSKGTITFAAEATTRTLTLYPLADNLSEPEETISISLVAGSGYISGTTGPVIATLQNDENFIPLPIEFFRFQKTARQSWSRQPLGAG